MLCTGIENMHTGLLFPVTPTLSRASFPKGFIFGASSASYQYEGAAFEDHRGPSIWDTFTNTRPDMIYDGKNGNEAVGFYHNYKEDVKLMKEMGLDAFRFSISWSRVMPDGRNENPKGVQFYQNLITELKASGIEPVITLFHWDVPQALDTEYGGFLNPKIVKDFRNYAQLCFDRFGKQVKYWTTLNEPWCFSYFGYGTGTHAPGRCSPMRENIEPFTLSYRGLSGQHIFTFMRGNPAEDHLFGGDSATEPYVVGRHQLLADAAALMDEIKEKNKDYLFGGDSATEPYVVGRHQLLADAAAVKLYRDKNQLMDEMLEKIIEKIKDYRFGGVFRGDSATEPYVVGRHQLLAHAATVKLYKDKYQASQGGKIGISLMSEWMMPKNDHDENDIEAAKRAVDFMFGWFMEPLVTGDYPKRMRQYVEEKRLPPFTKEERALLIGSFDFLDIHYYTARYVTDATRSIFEKKSCMTDPHVVYSVHRYNKELDKKETIGEQAGSQWLHCYPEGILKLLRHIKETYKNPIIYIMENGYNENNDNTLSADALNDSKRINYHYQHLSNVQKAIKEKIKVKGYFPWSLLDNFEWADGYSVRFGLFYIDYKDELKRRPKLSATWFKTIIKK